jgi:hypothetical protein
MALVKYMEHTHPDAFVDFPMKSPNIELGRTKLCAKCQGHGGWNLQLNSYSLHDYENTPENRHRYSHFICQCSNCYGWGFVHENQDCVHDWEYHKSLGKCLHQYKCIHCDKIDLVDSSD